MLIFKRVRFYASTDHQPAWSYSALQTGYSRHYDLNRLSGVRQKYHCQGCLFLSFSERRSLAAHFAAGNRECRVFAFAARPENTSELQSRFDLVCRLLLEKKNLI